MARDSVGHGSHFLRNGIFFALLIIAMITFTSLVIQSLLFSKAESRFTTLQNELRDELLVLMRPSPVDVQIDLSTPEVVAIHARYDFTGNANSSIGIPSNLTAYTYNTFYANDTFASQYQGFLRLNSTQFTSTVNQSTIGTLDHIKSLFLTSPISTPSSNTLVCEGTLRATLTGLANQPFTTAVLDSNSDYRLASGVFHTGDQTTGLFASFLFTNTKIYMMYGRSSLGRTNTNNYAAFTFVQYVGDTSQNIFKDVSISWNEKQGNIVWTLSGKEVFRVSKIGHLLSRSYMTSDRGGYEETIFPNQVECGFGLQTFLDLYPPCLENTPTQDGGLSCFQSTATNRGLVQLDTLIYLNPANNTGSSTFYDAASNTTSRLFGQGGILDIQNFSVYETST